MTVDPRCWAVVPAAGVGARFGNATPKQYLPLAGRTVIEWALAPFLEEPRIAGIAVALAHGDRHFEGLGLHAGKPLWKAAGGAHRWESVRGALQVLADHGAADGDWVLVHDAARPCLGTARLGRFLDVLLEDAVGGLMAVPADDTLKRADERDRVVSTLPRRGVWRAQTPQMFRLKALLEALEAGHDGAYTDEASAMEASGARPRLVAGSAANLKITTADDLALAECVLRGSAAG